MELQLGKQKRMMYARVFDRTEEETCSADAVVPDALGDIGTILVTEGTFCLWNLDFSDKSAQIEGSVAADVVYAEEGGALRSFPVELPVKVRISGETLSPDVRPWLRCTLTALDARAVNSRKVRVTARLSLCLRAYRETELALTDPDRERRRRSIHAHGNALLADSGVCGGKDIHRLGDAPLRVRAARG